MFEFYGLLDYTAHTRIESGMLYAVPLLAATIFQLVIDPRAEGILPVDLGVLAVQLSVSHANRVPPVNNLYKSLLKHHSQGLAPTLIIVRAAYGKSVNSMNQMVAVSTLRFEVTERPEGQSRNDPLTRDLGVDLRPERTESNDTNPAEANAKIV